MTNPARAALVALVALAASAAAAPGAWAQAATTTPAAPVTSANWAGYAATAASTATQALNFRTVSGSWVEPAATCTSPNKSYSAYWVGLGGFSLTSSGLEQIGSEADCDSSGNAKYSTWYELVPAAPVTLGMSISPGDQMEASVTVIKTHVTLRVRDLTSGAYISKSLRMAKPDTSSADWIVEAPSNCDGDNHCVPLPLSNFGNVSFTNSTAATATHTGPISDPTWSATQLELSGSAVRSGRGRYFGAIPEDSAVPTALSGLGNAFSVGWQQDTIAATSTGGTTVPSSGLYPGFGQGNGGAP